MNEESQPASIDPELEARIVALVVGEASDFEREELERLIELRPELALFRSQMQSVHGLLQDIGAGEFVTESEDWKLSADKRDVVLSTIRGEVQVQPVTPTINMAVAQRVSARRKLLWNVAKIAAVLLLVGTAGLMALPSVQMARESSRDAQSNLRSDVAIESRSVAEPSDFDVDGSHYGFDQSGVEGEYGGYENGQVYTDRSFYSPDGSKLFADGADVDYDDNATSALSTLRDTLKAPQTLPSPYYLQDDVQYFPAGPELQITDGYVRGGNTALKSQNGDEPASSDGPAPPPAPAAGPEGIAGNGARRMVERERQAGQQDEQKPIGEANSSWGELSLPQAPSPSGLPNVSRMFRNDRSEDLAPEQSAQADGNWRYAAPKAANESLLEPGSGGGGFGGFGGGGGNASSREWGKELGDFSANGEVTAERGERDSRLADPVAAEPSQSMAGGLSSEIVPLPTTETYEQQAFGLGRGESSTLGPSNGVTRSGDDAKKNMRGIVDGRDRTAGTVSGKAFEGIGSESGGKPGDELGSRVVKGAELVMPSNAMPGTKEVAPDLSFWDGQAKQDKEPVNDSIRGNAGDPFSESNFSEPSAEQPMNGLGTDLSYRLEELKAEIEAPSSERESLRRQPEELKQKVEALAPLRMSQTDGRGWFADLPTLNRKDAELYVTPRIIISEEEEEAAQTGFAPARRTAVPAGLDEKVAEQEAFSTFSLHVSDVSFKLAMAALARGEWPEAAKVRIEEFVNAFDYGDPMPSQNEKVACRVEQSIHPFLQQRNLLRVAMRTAAAGRSSNTPLRLTFLLDNSGSMERIDRQQTVRRAFATLAAQLTPMDQVTLISFARQPRLLADKVSGAQAQQLVNLIDGLPSEGGTNIEAALQLAFEKAREQRLDGAQNRIILLTDGAVNLGDANPDSLSQTITAMRAAGIAFDAAGISAEGLNDEVLEALTRNGDGRYYLLDSPESADDGFARQIAGALRPSAKNVKVQIEFNPARVGRYKLLGFEKHILKQEDFRNDKVDAAEMAAAEAGVALYQFEAKPDGEGDIGSVSVRFRDLSTGQMVENCWPIPYQAAAPRPDQAAPSLRIATAAGLLAAKLRGEPLGETVDLQTLSSLVAGLPDPQRNDPRVGQLQQMIQQARQLSGQ